MKKIITLLAFFHTSKVVLANNHFNCEMTKSGEVTIAYVYSEDINQKLEAFVGFEEWSEPFAVMAKCEMLKYELTETPIEHWSNYECIDPGMVTAKKFIEIKLSKRGKEILGNERNKLHFVPTWPIHSYFQYSVMDGKCDPR